MCLIKFEPLLTKVRKIRKFPRSKNWPFFLGLNNIMSHVCVSRGGVGACAWVRVRSESPSPSHVVYFVEQIAYNIIVLPYKRSKVGASKSHTPLSLVL